MKYLNKFGGYSIANGVILRTKMITNIHNFLTIYITLTFIVFMHWEVISFAFELWKGFSFVKSDLQSHGEIIIQHVIDSKHPNIYLTLILHRGKIRRSVKSFADTNQVSEIKIIQII